MKDVLNMPKKIMEKTRRNQLVVILVFLIWILLIKPLLFEMQINHLWVHIISFIIVSFVFVCGFIWWKERPKEKTLEERVKALEEKVGREVA